MGSAFASLWTIIGFDSPPVPSSNRRQHFVSLISFGVNRMEDYSIPHQHSPRRRRRRRRMCFRRWIWVSCQVKCESPTPETVVEQQLEWTPSGCSNVNSVSNGYFLLAMYMIFYCSGETQCLRIGSIPICRWNRVNVEIIGRRQKKYHNFQVSRKNSMFNYSYIYCDAIRMQNASLRSWISTVYFPMDIASNILVYICMQY